MDEIDRILQGSHESSAKMRSEVLTQMDGAGMDQGERVMVLGGALQPHPSRSSKCALRRMPVTVVVLKRGVEHLGCCGTGTNHPQKLEAALLRRFQKRVLVPLPAADGIRQILDRNMNVAADVDLAAITQRLAAPDQLFSASDIAGICENAKRKAFDRFTREIGFDQMTDDEVGKLSRDAAASTVTREDLEAVVQQAHSPVSRAEVEMYERWDAQNSV